MAVQFAAHRPAGSRAGDAGRGCPSSGRPRRKGPILPGFDIHIGNARDPPARTCDRASPGVARVGRVQGIGRHPRRAGDDRARRGARRQWRPDRAQARRRARPRPLRPRRAGARPGQRAAAGACSASKRPLDLVIDGDGSWTRWRGRAALDLSGRPAARLALGADNGRYRLAGTLAPAQFLKGKLPRLTAPLVRVRRRGDARRPATRRRAVAGLAVAARGRQGRRRSRRQPLPQCAGRRRSAAPAGPVPQHDRQQRAAGVDARRAVRDRRLRLSADLAAGGVRQHRLRRRPRRGAGPVRAVADAGAAAADARGGSPASATSPAGSSPICGSKACSASRRKLVRGDGLVLHQRQAQGQGVAADRPASPGGSRSSCRAG